MELEKELQNARKQASDFALAFDFMTKIVHSENEAEAIDSILAFIDILFMPEILYYISIQGDEVHHVHIRSGNEDKNEIIQRNKGFRKLHDWTPSGRGFLVKIAYQGIDFGVLEVDKVQFPENVNHYLNQALSLTEVCGLAIENARRNETIKKTEQRLRKEKNKLEEALADVKTLSGLLPICSYCKKIRDDSGYWKQIDEYIQKHSGLKFSHSICQGCAEEHFPDLDIYSD